MNDDKFTINDLLIELGLTVTETRVYLALLELEKASIRGIAEASGVNRGTTYEAIKKLQDSGLASKRRSGQREHYFAESPAKIYDIIRDKRKRLYQIQRASQRVIPELLAQKVRPEGKPLVRYYDNDSGVVAILRDVLQTCSQLDKPQYVAYSSKPLRQYIYRKFPNFTRDRIREGVSVRVIAIGAGGDPADLSARKWLPEPADSASASYTLIYGDKVAHISLAHGFLPYGVVIEDSGTAAMQRLLFEQLWQKL